MENPVFHSYGPDRRSSTLYYELSPISECTVVVSLFTELRCLYNKQYNTRILSDDDRTFFLGKYEYLCVKSGVKGGGKIINKLYYFREKR